MIAKTATDAPKETFKYVKGSHVLLIEGRFYEDIAEQLFQGATQELTKSAATFERISVPGALEIPQALAAAVDAYDAKSRLFDGAIALGCVIRGETAHFDIVCNMANHWLMDIAVRHGIPLGNSILTVNSRQQALERSSDKTGGKGADAARACLSLIELRKKFIFE